MAVIEEAASVLVTDGRGARVLVVDDHPLTRDSLRALLSREPNLSVCGEAGTLADARLMAARLLPDMILLDLYLPDGNGLDLLEEVRTWSNPPKVLVLSACDGSSPEAVEAFRLGAVGFVGKPTPGHGVLAAVLGVLGGQTQLPDSLIEKLIRRR